MTAEEIYPYIQDDTDERRSTITPTTMPKAGSRAVTTNPTRRRAQRARSPAIRRQAGAGTRADGAQSEPDESQAGASRPPPLSTTEREQLSVQWQSAWPGPRSWRCRPATQWFAGASRDHLLQPQLPWRMLLARYLTAIARDDYSYMRPSRREGAAILPSLRSSHH